MIGANTILGMDLFREEWENSLIFHIPHSKTEIPKQFKHDFVSVELAEKEIELLKDFATDEIFDISDTTKVIFPYSRIFCDVERLNDDDEVMLQYGRGFYYTNTDKGELLRENVNGNKQLIYDNYYLKHHKTLTDLVDEKLKTNVFAVLIDCHSFPDTPLISDLEQARERPDFCIGTDAFHSPPWLVDMVKLFLTEKGFSVKLNSPYKGTIVPLKHYQKNTNVYSVMIEINRKLYMEGKFVNPEKVKTLNKILSELFLLQNNEEALPLERTSYK